MKFCKIQTLKLSSNFKSDSINYASVIAAKLYNVNFKSVISYIVLTIFYNPRFSIKYKGSAKVLLSHNFIDLIRKDYFYIYQSFLSVCDCDCDEMSFERRFSFKTSFKNLAFFFYVLKKNIKFNLSFLDWLAVSSLESYYIRAHRCYISVDFSKYSSYVSFCDSYLEENLIAQMANIENITTATLQHGQYRVNLRGRESTDAESYLNFVSDYLFAWGEATKREFIKGGIAENRILVCGALKPFYEGKLSEVDGKADAICIVLNGDSHLRSSLDMLAMVSDFCEKYKVDFYIRPHPSSKNKAYLKYLSKTYCLGIHVEGRSYRQSIIHSSGVFVEMIMKGELFFIYKDEYLDGVFELPGRCFGSVKELSSLYAKGDAAEAEAEAEADKLKSFYNIAINEADLKKRYKLAVDTFLL